MVARVGTERDAGAKSRDEISGHIFFSDFFHFFFRDDLPFEKKSLPASGITLPIINSFTPGKQKQQ